MSNIFYPTYDFANKTQQNTFTQNQVYSSSIFVSGNLSGTLITGSSFTGSFLGTSSFANNSANLGGITANNYAISSNISSSFILKGELSGSFAEPVNISSSFAGKNSSNIFTQDQILSGNIVFKSGNGIDFSFNSNASGKSSELFDDYEEGTWTPNISSSTFYAGTTITYPSQNIGKYTKIGNVVYLFCALNATSSIQPTEVFIKNLPFQPASHYYANAPGSFVCHFPQSINTTGDVTYYAKLYSTDSGGYYCIYENFGTIPMYSAIKVAGAGGGTNATSLEFCCYYLTNV